MNSIVLKVSTYEVIQHLFYSVYWISLSIMSSKVIHVIANVMVYVFLMTKNYLKDILKFFSLGLYLEIEFLDHMEFNFQFTFSPTVHRGLFFSASSQYLLSHVFIMIIWTGVSLYLIVVYIYIYLIISNIEHLLWMCWPSISLLLKKLYFNVFNQLFWLLSCISSLHIFLY